MKILYKTFLVAMACGLISNTYASSVTIKGIKHSIACMECHGRNGAALLKCEPKACPSGFTFNSIEPGGVYIINSPDEGGTRCRYDASVTQARFVFYYAENPMTKSYTLQQCKYNPAKP